MKKNKKTADSVLSKKQTTKRPKFFNKKVATMLALVLALGAAVYMNWRFAEAVPPEIAESSAPADNESQRDSYGDALFVSSTVDVDAYFAEARLARSRSRDEALTALQNALRDTELSEAEKSELTAKLTAQANGISQEAKIESLLKAKGFENCVAYVYKESAKIVVGTGDNGLDAAQVAQIMETVISQTDISAQQISIVEVK